MIFSTCSRQLDLNFASNSQEAEAFSGANVTVDFYNSNEFLFLIEVTKAFYYYISYYFFMYFETFVNKLILTHSAGLTIVNKDGIVGESGCQA